MNTHNLRPMKLPLKITRNAQCFMIRDANGYGMAYVYFDDSDQRSSRGMITQAEAEATAKVIARALTGSSTDDDFCGP